METVFWLGAFILMAGHRNLLIWAVALLSQPPNIFALRAAYGMLLVAPHFIAGGVLLSQGHVQVLCKIYEHAQGTGFIVLVI